MEALEDVRAVGLGDPDSVVAHAEADRVERYGEFCESSFPNTRALVVEYFASPQFDELLVDIVRATFPAHEHEAMVERHRGLVGAWVEDQR